MLPYARRASSPASILTLARAFGETAPLLLVGAATAGFAHAADASLVERLTGPTRRCRRSSSAGRASRRTEFRALTAAAIIVLLVVVLLINALAIILRNRYARKW